MHLSIAFLILVLLAGHPMLHHGPTLLRPRQRFTAAATRANLRFGVKYALCVRRQREQGLRKLLERLLNVGRRDPAMQNQLRSRPITSLLARAEGETGYQAVFRYRLAMGALNLRSNTGEILACPHEWCATPATEMSLSHIVWECESARRIWQLVHQQWTRRQPRSDMIGQLRNSIGVEEPVLARAIRQSLKDTCDDSTLIASAISNTWKIIQAVVPHQLWLRRNEAAFQGTTDSVHAIAAKIWATILHQLQALAAAKRVTGATYEFGCVLSEIIRGLEVDAASEAGAPREVRLYYDGGARGNPGVSGAGSVIIERETPTSEWVIIWWAATYLGDANTNNEAEHTALAQGLEEAANRYGTTTTKVTVIGDSMLATRQLQGRASVRAGKLAKAVRRSRLALLQIFDYEFRHTLRAGNKTADRLANMAMDTKLTTTSPTAPITTFGSTMSDIHPLILLDVDHPHTPPTHSTDLVARIRTLLGQQAAHHQPNRKRPRPNAILTRNHNGHARLNPTPR